MRINRTLNTILSVLALSTATLSVASESTQMMSANTADQNELPLQAPLMLSANYDHLSNMEKWQELMKVKNNMLLTALLDAEVQKNTSESQHVTKQLELYQAQNSVFTEAVKIADQRFGAFFPELSDKLMIDVLKEVLVARNMSMQDIVNETQSDSCPLKVYNEKVAYRTYNVAYNYPTSIARTVNEEGEWPCDYEVYFKNGSDYVYGTNSAMRSLLDNGVTGFGGQLISRSGGKYILLGYWRTHFYFGIPPLAKKWIKSSLVAF